FFFLSYCSGPPRDLHSFPTRRSSDLGVLADRLDARRTVIGTQTAQLISASALAWIALGGFAEPWMLYTIAFINGTVLVLDVPKPDRKSTRLNSSHVAISYAVFCLKKK